MKAHILVVEDDGVLYLRLKKLLEKENYTVSKQARSVEEAIVLINKEKPNLALLDIKLKGELTGLDLGKMLHETYKIPFIYVTDFDDDETFFKGLHTNHDNFMVKTKPNLDDKLLLRNIQTVLYKQEKQEVNWFKKGIMGYTNYINATKENSGSDEITRIPVLYEDIVYLTTYEVEIIKDEANLQNTEVKEQKKNYLMFRDTNNQKYYMEGSLKSLKINLPYHFVQITGSEIINILHPAFKGRINGTRIKIDTIEKPLAVSDTYKRELNNRIAHFFETKK